MKVLERAIQKAIDNGWAPSGPPDDRWLTFFPEGTTPGYRQTVQLLMTDHDFAKALWGEKLKVRWRCPAYEGPGGCYTESRYEPALNKYCSQHGQRLQRVEVPDGWQPWEDHLQQMVISDDPIKYLEENLDGKDKG